MLLWGQNLDEKKFYHDKALKNISRRNGQSR